MRMQEAADAAAAERTNERPSERRFVDEKRVDADIGLHPYAHLNLPEPKWTLLSSKKNASTGMTGNLFLCQFLFCVVV